MHNHNNGMANSTALSKETILKQRAKILQEPAIKLDVCLIENGINCLEFLLSEERYAFDSTFVNEVIRYRDITPLPCSRDFILGIINQKTGIISVINIKKFYDIPEKEITDQSRVVIVKHGEIELGILVDKVIGNTKISLDTIQKNPNSITEIDANSIIGVSKDRTIILDIEELLSSNKIIVNDEV